jgi:hypothetical protein
MLHVATIVLGSVLGAIFLAAVGACVWVTCKV